MKNNKAITVTYILKYSLKRVSSSELVEELKAYRKAMEERFQFPEV